MKDPMLTVQEVAVRLRISESMVRKLIARGNLPAIHLGRRVLIEEIDLEAYIQASKTGTQCPAAAKQ